MTTEQLYNELNYVDHSREKRLHYAHLLIMQPELLPKVLEILFMVNDKTSPRAAWVLEFMCGEKLDALVPYLDTFTTQIKTIHLDSAVRPIAKICEYIAKAYYSNSNSLMKSELKDHHKEKIIEVCFDYMINDEKIAPKAYSMNTLFLFGKDYEWIHPELAIILERDFTSQSAGFKARAIHLLKKIKK